MIRQLCILFIFILIAFYFPCAQDVSYRFVNFNYKDGLRDKFFYDAVNDKNGMIWIASGSGIYSYDGNRFVLYRPQNKQTGTEFSNLIRSIYFDTNGIIWAAGLNGLQWFNPETKKFSYHSNSNQSLKQLSNAVINHFFRDSKGNMWVATQKKGVALVNDKDSSVVFYKSSDEPGASSDFISQIIETPGNKIWAISIDGLHLLEKGKGIVETFRSTRPGKNAVDENNFRNAFYDRQMNCIWIASYGGGVVKFNLNTKQLEHYDIFSRSASQTTIQNGITAIAPKSENELWISNGDLSVFDKQTHQLIRQIIPDISNEYGFKTTGTAKIYSDKENNLWLCSFNGISMLPWQNNQWQNITLKDKNDGNLILEPTSVCKIPGSDNLFIATSGAKGIGFYEPASNKFSIINIQNNVTATAVHVFRDNVYVAAGNDVYVYDSAKKIFHLLPIKYKSEQIKGPVWRIMNDGKSSLIIVSPQNGFYTYHLVTGKTEHYNIWNVDSTVNPSETENTIWPSYADSRGNVWFTRSQFLYYADAENHFHKVAFEETKEKPAIIQPFEIVEDANHHFWITTKINGIYEWYADDKGKESIRNYNTANTPALPSDYFIRVVKDEQGMLWFGSLSGLVKFDPLQKKVVTVFRKKHGLVNDNIDVPLSLLPGNTLVISNFGVLNLLNINNYQINKTSPVPAIVSFRVMDKLIPIGQTDTTIVLPYNENFLQLELAAISYNNSDENKFAYMMEGVDKDWVYTSRNYVSYSALTDGIYSFKLKTANNDNIWSNKNLQVKIIIKPPFWKTWWFISLLAFVTACIIYWFYRSRIVQIQKEEKLKSAFHQQIAETEMKALRAQMNPHFIFNSLNSIQKYILKNEHFEASQYLTKFSRLIRLILDHSNQNNILLGSEIDLLKLYVEMESLRFDNKFDYEINVANDISTETREIPSMLIQPYVENAIWHGLLHKEEKGKLTVEFLKENNNLVVIIDDNGIGREKAGELKSKQVLKKKSYGMQITEDRIKIINRINQIHATCEITDKKDEEGNVGGTRVKLVIPLL